MSLQDIDTTFQNGEDPPWDNYPPVDGQKANIELENRLIFYSWTCRFCGDSFAVRSLAIKHAIDCTHNEDNHTCDTCGNYSQRNDSYGHGFIHVCKANPKRFDEWHSNCIEWVRA